MQSSVISGNCLLQIGQEQSYMRFDKNLCPIPSKLWNKLDVNFTHKFSHIDLSCSVYFSDADSSKN